MYVWTNLFDLFLRKVFFRKVNSWQIFVDCLGLFAKGAIQKNTNRKCSDCGAYSLKKWHRNFFVVAWEFFASHAKIKKFTNRVLRSSKRENFRVACTEENWHSERLSSWLQLQCFTPKSVIGLHPLLFKTTFGWQRSRLPRFWKMCRQTEKMLLWKCYLCSK